MGVVFLIFRINNKKKRRFGFFNNYGNKIFFICRFHGLAAIFFVLTYITEIYVSIDYSRNLDE